MKTKHKLFGMIIVLLMLSFFCNQSKVGAAIQYDAPRTLFVYDSLNQADKAEEKVQLLTRLLTSLGQEVKLENMKEYRKGELQKGNYQAVITMENWPSMHFRNEDFEKDRQNFDGLRLHIGSNLTSNEKKTLGVNLQTAYQQEYTLFDKDKRYSEEIGFKKQIDLPIKLSQETKVYSYVKTQDGNQYPYAIQTGNDGYIPFFDDRGASLLATCEWLGEIYQSKCHYVPYISVLGYSPLSSPNLTPYIKKQFDKLENQIILVTRSTTQNTGLKAFKAYINTLKNYSKDGQIILYLDVPAVNTIDRNNNDLKPMLEQEVSTMIENQLFPLGIGAPTYWNNDRYYQQNALSIGKSVLLYQQNENQLYHTSTSISRAYTTAICAINHSAFDNVDWNINGKYTDYTFPMPVALSYDYPTSKKAARHIVSSVLNDAFPPNNDYMYQIDGGMTTTTQLISNKNGIITLNGIPVTHINFDSRELKDARSNIQANGSTKSASGSKAKGIMGRLDNILTIIIVATLIILTILLIIGRGLYHKMFVVQKKANKEATNQVRIRHKKTRNGGE